MEKLTINREKCKGCGLCVSVCPKKILRLSEDGFNAKGYRAVEVTDIEKCISCAMCATICPDVVIRVERAER
ncbi:MAG TPA: 4Fe-4S binding protein [Firmicutes bacterium]|nr:4Fe-4S binding protein [Bacillota bacterium]